MACPPLPRHFLNAALSCLLLFASLAPSQAQDAANGAPTPSSPQNSATKLIYAFRGIETADIAWLKQAAEQGFVAAQLSLARNYRLGKGVERDLNQQLIWLTKATKQNFDWAAYELGRVYETGEGVAASDELARKWYRQAAQNGLVPAMRRLADLKDGEDGGKFWQLKFDRSVALDLRYAELSKSLQADEANKPSDSEVYAALEKLASDGHSLARQQVAIRQITGRGTQSNVEGGLRELLTLDGEGNRSAAQSLGEIYLQGNKVERDVPKAVAYLKKASDANQPKALVILAGLYESGNGVPQDMPMAHMTYRVAAEQGDKSAQLRLGTLFEQGIGTAKDSEKATHWYKQAAQQNVQAAKEALARLGGTAPQVASTSTSSQVVINTNKAPDPRTQALLLNVDKLCQGLNNDEREMIDGQMRAEAGKQNQDPEKLLVETRDQAGKISCGAGAKNLLRMGVTANLKSRYQEFKAKDGEVKYWAMLVPARLINRRCKLFGEEKAQELDRLADLLDQRILGRVRSDQTLALAIARVEDEFANVANKSACDANAKQMIENAIKISNTVSKKRGHEF